MAGAVRVFAPVQELGEVDGVTLVLLTVEVLDDLTVVRFYCPSNARTRALDEEHERHMQEFIERFHRGDRTPPPEAPAHTLLAGDVYPRSITLDDGCGTEFSFHSGQTGGPGEWLIDAKFRGVPAPQARDLTVSLALPNATTLSARIALLT
jgi:hypothetical protein